MGHPRDEWLRFVSLDQRALPLVPCAALLAISGRHDRHGLATLAFMHLPGYWLVVGFLAVVETAVVVTALRMRVRSPAARSVVGGRAAEVFWTLLPALLLAALALLSFQAG